MSSRKGDYARGMYQREYKRPKSGGSSYISREGRAAINKKIIRKNYDDLVERKFSDNTIEDDALTTQISTSLHNPNLNVTSLTSTQQGNGDEHRKGRLIQVTKCYVSGNIHMPFSASLLLRSTPVIVVFLVLDKHPNGANLDPLLVFKNPGGAFAPNESVGPLRNLNHTTRFKVLDSVTVTPEQENFQFFAGPPANIWWYSGWQKQFKLSWKGDMTCEYDKDPMFITSQVTNSISVLAWCNDNGRAVTIGYNARIRFNDK